MLSTLTFTFSQLALLTVAWLDDAEVLLHSSVAVFHCVSSFECLYSSSSSSPPSSTSTDQKEKALIGTAVLRLLTCTTVMLWWRWCV